MQFPPSLCIDLGASYTKVAFRPRPDARSHLLQHPELPDEHHFCIPSVAARNTETNAWVFGAEAMDLRPSRRVEVFHNWKATLFVPDTEREVGFDVLDGAAPAAEALLLERYPALRALDVATRFLRWLHGEQIPAMVTDPGLSEAEVQLCVPEFVLADPLATRLEHILRKIGFGNSGAYTLSEPKANVIGILTEGQNALTGTGQRNLGAMFGDARVLRTLARPDQAVLLVDVGDFTTDLALAKLAPASASGIEDPAISVRLGVRRLDDQILHHVDAEARERVNGSAAEREHYHATVFGGVAAPNPAEFGLSMGQVDSAVEQFTRAIVEAVDAFLGENLNGGSVFAAVLTGGGSNIRGVANRLARALSTRKIRALHAPQSTDAPAQLRKYALGPQLVRGASAIGGCSILYRDPSP